MRAVFPVIHRSDVTGPPLGAHLDQKHPLAEGLLGFWCLTDEGFIAYNKATGVIDTFLSGATARYLGQGAAGQEFVRSSLDGVTLTPTALLTPNFPVTMVGRINLRTANVVQTLWGTRTRTINSADGLYMAVSAAGLLLCDAGAGGGTGATNLRRRQSTISLTAGKWQTVGCSYRSFASDFSVFIDGIDRTGSAVGTGAAFANTSGVPAIAIQQAVGAIGYGDFRCQWFGIWARPLTADEHAELAVNPFAMFRQARELGVYPPPQELDLPFIASVTAVYPPALVGTVTVPFISSSTVVYPPTLSSPEVDVPFIASVSQVFAPTLIGPVNIPFIASKTRVFRFSVFTDTTREGIPGNGGESFQVELAPSGSSVTATLAASITSTSTLLSLTGDAGLPDAFVVTIDDETMYVAKIIAGSYRIRRRGTGNTTAAPHTAGAAVVWTDSYDLAIVAGANIDHEFTADITSSGLYTYPGWLICIDSSQAYLGASRYPMHVTEVVGVFDAGAGTTGTNRCDAAQPSAIATVAAISNDCPAGLSNPSRISTDIVAGDVAVLRYTNSEGSILKLGARSAALQSWFGLKRVDAADVDVTLTDPTGYVVDTNPGTGPFTGSVNGEWDDTLGPGIGPDTGLPTSHDVPYTSVTLPHADRNFTIAAEKGWPICALAVRQGKKRVPLWRSWDWHNFTYIYSGFDVDATFCQLLINRNGIVFGSVPAVDLPGSQDIDGPDAVWDDGDDGAGGYFFGASWYVAIFSGPYIVAGPSIGGSGGDGGGGGGGGGNVVPVVIFTGGGGTIITVPPFVEGGGGGDISPPAPATSRFFAGVV